MNEKRPTIKQLSAYSDAKVATKFARTFLPCKICVCRHARNVFFNTKTCDLMSIFLFVNRQVKCLTVGEKKSKKYIGVFDLFTYKVVQTQVFSKKNRQNQPEFPQHNPIVYVFSSEMKE